MERAALIRYKFLSAGAVGLFSRHTWPTPTGGAAGEWVRAEGEIQPCLNGIHACARTRLVDWLDDELWEIELEDAIETDGELVARAGRLVRRVERWNDECARAFVSDCVRNTVARAARSLARAGRTTEAAALTAARSGPDDERGLLQLARGIGDEETSPALYLADIARLERGGRPALDEEPTAAEVGGPTPAALAANLGYVCAHIAAQLAEQETAGAYDEAFARERLRQSNWLAAELRVEH